MSRKSIHAEAEVAIATMPSATTTPAQLERVAEHLRKLRLLKSGERLEAMLQHAAARELPYAEFLEQVLGEEVAAKTSKNIAMRTAMARFPFAKPLETFDFSYQPSIDRKQVLALASCHFIEHGDNVIVLGPPGVGKTHLAVSLGIKAIEAGYRVRFTTAANDHRRDRIPAYRPTGRQSGLPADQPPLRARPDDPDQQPELCRLGRRVR
jgi:chromosomal replication initiation ATPase DnaA